MRTVRLAIVGLGNVGRRLLELIEMKNALIRTRYDFELVVQLQSALLTARDGQWIGNPIHHHVASDADIQANLGVVAGRKQGITQHGIGAVRQGQQIIGRSVVVDNPPPAVGIRIRCMNFHARDHNIHGIVFRWRIHQVHSDLTGSCWP